MEKEKIELRIQNIGVASHVERSRDIFVIFKCDFGRQSKDPSAAVGMTGNVEKENIEFRRREIECRMSVRE